MRSSILLHFILSSLLPTFVTAATTPLPPPPPQNLTDPALKFTCVRKYLQTQISPHPSSCAAVLRTLPSSVKEATFHLGGPDDGFQLPLAWRYGDCEVLVETAEMGVNDPVSSWVEIGLAAMELNVACFAEYGRRVGGWTYCGEGGGVKVTLRGRGGRVET